VDAPGSIAARNITATLVEVERHPEIPRDVADPVVTERRVTGRRRGPLLTLPAPAVPVLSRSDAPGGAAAVTAGRSSVSGLCGSFSVDRVTTTATVPSWRHADEITAGSQICIERSYRSECCRSLQFGDCLRMV